MKLYIGGAWQGQEELARRECPEGEIIPDFHEIIRRHTGDAREFAEAFYQAHPQAVVTANEVGGGIVPMDPEERAWREACGRALCVLASHAEAVTRVVCGIGVRIK